MSIYKVINCLINIEINEELLDSSWQKFYLCDKMAVCSEEKILYDITLKPFEFDIINQDIKLTKFIPCSHVVSAYNKIMVTDINYSLAYVQPSVKEAYNIFLNYLFYGHAIKAYILQFHCSIIEYRGTGIIFLGPSGIGKTTQAEKWEEYRGAKIINGDIGYVQKTSQGFVVWGTPWHGSSPYCLNTSVPLAALVILKQSKKNRIRKLEGFEKLAEVTANVFYPTWIEDGISLCMDILGELLDNVPVYCLDNTADEKSIEILEEELKYL